MLFGFHLYILDQGRLSSDKRLYDDDEAALSEAYLVYTVGTCDRV